MTSPSRCRRPSAEFFLTIQNLQRSLSNVGVLNIFDFRVSICKWYAWPCSASVAESRVINHLYWFFLVVKFRSAWLPLLILNEPFQNNLPKLSLTFEAFLEAWLCERPRERKDWVCKAGLVSYTQKCKTFSLLFVKSHLCINAAPPSIVIRRVAHFSKLIFIPSHNWWRAGLLL